MPHGNTGPQHHCPGARGAVSIRPGVSIPAGNCRWDDDHKWCMVHEHYCSKHNWAYSKKDQCGKCQEEKAAAKRKKDDEDREKRRKKREDQRNNPKPKKTPKTGNWTKTMTQSPIHKTRSTTANNTKSFKAKMAASVQKALDVHSGDHQHSWVHGKKTIDLDQLVKDATVARNDRKKSCSQDPGCVFNKISQQGVDILSAIRPYIITETEHQGPDISRSVGGRSQERIVEDADHRYNLRSRF